jgi:hypothetical protein
MLRSACFSLALASGLAATVHRNVHEESMVPHGISHNMKLSDAHHAAAAVASHPGEHHAGHNLHLSDKTKGKKSHLQHATHYNTHPGAHPFMRRASLFKKVAAKAAAPTTHAQKALKAKLALLQEAKAPNARSKKMEKKALTSVTLAGQPQKKDISDHQNASSAANGKLGNAHEAYNDLKQKCIDCKLAEDALVSQLELVVSLHDYADEKWTQYNDAADAAGLASDKMPGLEGHRDDVCTEEEEEEPNEDVQNNDPGPPPIPTLKTTTTTTTTAPLYECGSVYSWVPLPASITYKLKEGDATSGVTLPFWTDVRSYRGWQSVDAGTDLEYNIAIFDQNFIKGSTGTEEALSGEKNKTGSLTFKAVNKDASQEKFLKSPGTDFTLDLWKLNFGEPFNSLTESPIYFFDNNWGANAKNRVTADPPTLGYGGNVQFEDEVVEDGGTCVITSFTIANKVGGVKWQWYPGFVFPGK